jgi:hypothetical protein
MEEFQIIPKVRLGKIELGMSRSMVHHAMGKNFIEITRDGVIYDSYEDYSLHIHYENDTVNFIEISNNPVVEVLYENTNIFNTPAESLIAYLVMFSDYLNTTEARLGYSYIFNNLGISLYRSNVFKEETLNESWFKNLTQEEKDEELKFLYFESVSVWSEGYYNVIQDILEK